MFIAFVVVFVFDAVLFIWAYRSNHKVSKEQREHQAEIASLDAWLKNFRCSDKEDQD